MVPPLTLWPPDFVHVPSMVPDPSLALSPAPCSCQAPAGGESIVSGDWGPPPLDADAPRLGARSSRQLPSSNTEAVGVGWEIQGPGGDGPMEADRSRLVLGGSAELACRSLAPRVPPLKAPPFLGSSPPLLQTPSRGSRDAFPGRKEVSQGGWREEQPKPEWDCSQPCEEVMTSPEGPGDSLG